MVEVIKVDRGPRLELHHVERSVHGNGVAVKVYGEMLIGAKERVYAYEMGLNTIQVLVLTSETGTHNFYHPQKWIYHKGEYNNYASIDILNASGTEITPGNGDYSGSVWLDFIALGE